MVKDRWHTICTVKNCRNTRANSNCRFFRFPKDYERAKLWIIACNRQDLMLKTVNYLYAVNRVCSNHFEERMYANDLKNRLLPSAQPTLNLNKIQENDRNIAIKANFHDYTKTAVASEFLLQNDTPASLNCTNVQMNVSSTAGNSTNLHDSGVKHNKITPENVILKPIDSDATSFQPSIVVSSANYTIVENSKIIVTPTSDVVRPFSPERVLRNTQHNTVQLPAKRSLDKIVQTTDDLYAPSLKQLKLQNENQILRKENAALREKIEKMNLNTDQFLKCSEKYLSPQTTLFIKSIINSIEKDQRSEISLKI